MFPVRLNLSDVVPPSRRERRTLFPKIIRFDDPSQAERRRVERFIEAAYADAYGSRIPAHYPTLMSVQDESGAIYAAVGFRPAAEERLFLEQYLTAPVEKVLGALSVRATRDGEAVLAEIKRPDAPALIRALVEQGVDIHEAKWVGADLESIFFTETGAVQEADDAR